MKISVSQLSLDTLAALASRVLDISKKAAYAAMLNNPLLVALMAAFDDFFAVFDKATFSLMGRPVEVADLYRDNIFSGMKNCLLGLTKMEGLSIQQDAKDLYAIFELHGLDLDRYSYGDQSSHIDKLLETVDLPVNVLKIEQVNLTQVYALMKSSHVSFKNKFGEQMGANAVLRQTQSASSIRNNLEFSLRNYLNLSTAMKQTPVWNQLYTDLDEAVKAARNSNQPTPEVTPETPAV